MNFRAIAVKQNSDFRKEGKRTSIGQRSGAEVRDARNGAFTKELRSDPS